MFKILFINWIYWKYYVKLYYFLVHRLPQVATHALNTCAWNQWILVLIVDVIFRPFTKKIKTKTMHEMRPCIVFTTLPILDNFGNKCHLRRAERNTVIQRSRALLSSRPSPCIHCLVSGIHMIFIRHVLRSSGSCSSGGCSSGGCPSGGWPKKTKSIKLNEIKFSNWTSLLHLSLHISQGYHYTYVHT